MTVKLYASRDSEGRPWPPDYSFEVRACIDIVRQLWLSFCKQDALYAVAVNLHAPSADLVVISEHGLGVIELKHYSGHIRALGNAWFADGVRIRAGSVDVEGNPRYNNPYEQVQDYARQIRDRLIKPSRPPGWLPGMAGDWEKFKIQTAVCFTHPDANIHDLIAAQQKARPVARPAWEEFSILTSLEVSDWAAALRFGAKKGKGQYYEPHRLTPHQIVNIAERLLRATEWTDIVGIMPTGEPYAYLALIEGGVCTVTYRLDRDDVILGRDPDVCAVPLPQYFSRVSREHAQITRAVEGIFLEDLNSKNGTFVNGQPIMKPVRLEQGQIITLGGPVATDKVCHLLFSREPIDSPETRMTTTR